MCLIGCFFIVIEHERILVDRLDVQEIGAVVRLHGGEIEFGPRAYNSVNSERVTHIICESMRHHLVQQVFFRWFYSLRIIFSLRLLWVFFDSFLFIDLSNI